MTAKEIMLSAIRAQICGAQSLPYACLSEDMTAQIYALTKEHDMAHLVAAEFDKQGLLSNNQEISEKFRKQYMLAILRYERINYEYLSVCSAFDEAEICYIPLKGSVIRSHYPEPWMRTSCDIDVLVKESNLDKATDVLQTKLSYKVKGKSIHDISLFSDSGVHVELHYTLAEDGISDECRAILENAWIYSSAVRERTYMYKFSDEMYYFYHIAHMAKHFEQGGCGVRPFADLWILDNQIEFSKEERDSFLAEGGLLVFADACRKLSNVWFGDADMDAISKQMENYIFRGGIYGTLDNRVIVQQNKKGGRLRFVLSRLWIPYNEIKFQYPILQRFKALMPVMEVWRWFKLLFRKRLKHSVKVVKVSSSISQEQMTATAEFLKSIGLTE